MLKRILLLFVVILVICTIACEPVVKPNPEGTPTPTPTNSPPPPTPVPTPASPVVNITIHENCTRQPLGTGSSLIMETFQVDKKEAGTIFLIEGTLSGHGNNAGSMTQGWKYGTSDEVVGQSVMYDENAHSKIYSTTAVIHGHSETGLQILTFRYYSANGTTTSRPFNVYNPNSTDDARLAQTCSRYIVWEIRP